jgi:hypothetical protein
MMNDHTKCNYIIDQHVIYEPEPGMKIVTCDDPNVERYDTCEITSGTVYPHRISLCPKHAAICRQEIMEIVKEMLDYPKKVDV